jgi:hypothetical protein
MSRPTNKPQLLTAAAENFDKLFVLVNSLDTQALTKPGVNGDWAVKDILAHLNAWHSMMEIWYSEGMAGKKPQIPAPGFTWKTTPELNAKIFLEHKDEDLQLVIKKLKESHTHMLQLINAHTDEELFQKKKYAWTGTTSVGAYFVSCTSSHYQWAADMIKKWLRAKL